MTNLFLLGLIIVGVWFIVSTGSQVLEGKRRFQAAPDQVKPVRSECFGIKNGKITLIPCSEAFRDD